MQGATLYHEKLGLPNTQPTLAAALKRANELKIEHIVLASTNGNTAVKAVELFTGHKLIAVSHASNIEGPNTQEFTDENRQLFTSKGGVIFTGTHLFAGVSRAVRFKMGTYELGEIMASTLRIMGDGFKVAIEVAIMAADAGLVPVDKDIISIGGKGQGADTAIVLKPVSSNNFFDLRVREVICKPRF